MLMLNPQASSSGKSVSKAMGKIALGRISQKFRWLTENFTDAEAPLSQVPAQVPGEESSDYASFNAEVVRVDPQGQIISREQRRISYYSVDLGQGVTLEMVPVPAGTFTMGQTNAEKAELIRQVGRKNYKHWYGGELPRHSVRVPAFSMGKYLVTQAQWRAVAALPKVNRDLSANPAKFKGDNRPVEQVSWEEAMEFCDRLSAHSGQTYTLPSEAQWEYACRAGTLAPFHCGETTTTDLANYQGVDGWEHEGKTYPGCYGQGPRGENRQQTTDVGSFPANAFGLYDMHGNLFEWCLDHFHHNYRGAPTDGSAWVGGDSGRRILRGGSWGVSPRACRCAYRFFTFPAEGKLDLIGFRVVRVSPRPT